MDKIQEFVEDYKSLLQIVHERKHVLKISTMTMVGELDIDSLQSLDLKNIKQYVEKNKKFVQTKYTDNNKDFTVTKRGKIKKTFFNQLTINYEDISKKSIKIFTNGKYQITGLSSYIESILLSKEICSWIKECNEGMHVKIKTLNIGMINSNFKVAYNINLQELQRIIIENYNIYSRYDPDTYPAINIKYVRLSRIVSIFIFASGNIVITGAKCIIDIKDCYIYINDILEMYTKNIGTSFNINVKQSISKNDYIVDGYDLKQLLSCVTN